MFKPDGDAEALKNVEHKRVQQVDPDAFIIVYDANEVLGKGFGAYQPGSV